MWPLNFTSAWNSPVNSSLPALQRYRSTNIITDENVKDPVMATLDANVHDFSAQKLALLKMASNEPDNSSAPIQAQTVGSVELQNHIPPATGVVMRQTPPSPSPAPSLSELKITKPREIAAAPVREATAGTSSSAMTTMRSVSQSARRLTHSRHRSVSATARYHRSHEHKHSTELSEKVESHFSAIVEFLSNTSREAASLRECWGRIHSERDTLYHEYDELVERIEIITEQIDRLESEKRSHVKEISERKREVERLLLELSTAQNALSIAKKRTSERERDIERLQREYKEMEEKHTLTQADLQRVRTEYEMIEQTLRTVQTQFDKATEESDKFHRELMKVTRERTEAYNKLTDVTGKYEHARRDLHSLRERVKEFERERESLTIDLQNSREEVRILITERDELKEHVGGDHKRYEESRRRIIELEDSLRKSETLLSTSRSELQILKDRFKNVERERDEAVHKHSHYLAEISEYKEQTSRLQIDLRTVTETRDKLSDELDRARLDREEAQDDLARCQTDNREIELDNERLRTALREARAQKERAIAARHLADRERDEYINKYEEKCREMERIDGTSSAHRSHRHYHQSGDPESRDRSPYERSRLVSHTDSVVHSTT